MPDVAVVWVFSFWALAWVFMCLYWMAPAMDLAVEVTFIRWREVVAQIGPTSYFNVTVVPLVGGLSGALFGVSITKIFDEGVEALRGVSASVICLMLGIGLVISLPILHLSFAKEYDERWAIPFKIASLKQNPDPGRIQEVIQSINQEMAKASRPFTKRRWATGLAASGSSLLLWTVYWGALEERGATIGSLSAESVIVMLGFLSPLVVPVVGVWLKRKHERMVSARLTVQRAELAHLRPPTD